MNRLSGFAVVMTCGLGIFFIRPAEADVIEMVNGDVLNGEVISLDAQQLILKSELLGELKLERQKVSAIHLGEKPVLPRQAPPNQAPAADKPPLDPEVQNVLNAVPSSDEVLKQLQQGGAINPAMIGELQTKFPLLNTPEAGQYFNDTLGGLMTGRLNIQDVRKDAITARDGLRDLQKELGPEGAALNGYMSILNKFINETGTAPNANPPAQQKPEAQKPAAEEPKRNTPATFPPKQ